jgi:hypothetical protein
MVRFVPNQVLSNKSKVISTKYLLLTTYNLKLMTPKGVA